MIRPPSWRRVAAKMAAVREECGAYRLHLAIDEHERYIFMLVDRAGRAIIKSGRSLESAAEKAMDSFDGD